MKLNLSSKKFGLFLLIPSILIFLGASLFLVLMILSINVYINWYSLSMLIAVIVFILSLFPIYISVRYLKNNPFKKNKELGYVFLIIGVFYFFNKVFTYIFNEITKLNPGAWGQLVLGFIIGFCFVLIGIGFLFVKKN